MNRKRLLFLGICTLVFAACGEKSDIPSEPGVTYSKPEVGLEFKEPNIKDDFCGTHINFQFCKCAFHNKYCGNIGMDKDAAHSHVQKEFGGYVADLRKNFGTACEQLGGNTKGDQCMLCASPSEFEGGRCITVAMEESEIKNEEGGDEKKEVAKEDCGDLDNNWEQYSDFDYRIPNAERSYEAKQYAQAKMDIVDVYAEKAELAYETEILRSQIVDILDYKDALVKNLRSNLIKATMRLTYTTYSQIKGAKGAGESFSKFLTSTESIEVLGAGMKTVQAVIPGDSRLAINTKSAPGKIGSIGWNATLEAIESMGDPVAIAKQVVKDSKGAIMPSADITPEEVEILRIQNLENNLLNEVITEIEAEIADNEQWLSVADAVIQQKESDAIKWSAEEKARVLLMLEDECK